MEHFGINTQENYSNSYLVALFSNGQMMQCEDGVKFQCESPKLFRILENCTFNILTRKVCSTGGVPSTTFINKLYIRRPTLKEDGAIMYDVIQISTDDDVAEIIRKSHLPINTIIELFVTFTRSAEEILTLLQPTPSSSSTISNPIPHSPANLYYGGPLRRASITDSPYGYGLYFRSNITVTMSIPHNFTFGDLLQKIMQKTHCGTRFVITHIIYHRPMKIVNNKLIHDTTQIKIDTDVAQMLKRWKEVQRLDLSVAILTLWQYIELFIQATEKLILFLFMSIMVLVMSFIK